MIPKKISDNEWERMGFNYKESIIRNANWSEIYLIASLFAAAKAVMASSVGLLGGTIVYFVVAVAFFACAMMYSHWKEKRLTQLYLKTFYKRRR